MKFNNIKEVVKYMDSINPKDIEYRYNRDYFYENLDWYKAILQGVLNLKEKPKRVIDVGSNFNVFGFLFENEDIEYIGVEVSFRKRHKPFTSDKVKFINKDYYEVREEFKDDVIISNLCIGYQVPVEDIKCKHLIVGALTEKGTCTYKQIK